MRYLVALALALLALNGRAATAYVSDELVLGVYADQNQQGQRLTTLLSGASVETLATAGEFTQVRLSDGTTGWVKSTYLTTREPATVRVKQLEEELDRSRATTPALAEAAARSEALHLQRELAMRQSELDAARIMHSQSSGATIAVSPVGGAGTVTDGVAVCAMLIAAVCGFWLGYVTLARRIRQKFGGIRVY